MMTSPGSSNNARPVSCFEIQWNIMRWGPFVLEKSLNCKLQSLKIVFWHYWCFWKLTFWQGCKRDLSLRDRDIRFLVRDETETKTFLQFHETETSNFCHETETETLQGRDRDVFRDLQPSALCQNNEWRTCLSWHHKQLTHCNCNVHYHELYSPHKH